MIMRMRQKLGISLTALLILLHAFPLFMTRAEAFGSGPIETYTGALQSDSATVSGGETHASVSGGDPASSIPGKAPAFSACVEYRPQGYVVRGSLTEIPTGLSSVQVLYSLDGETYLVSEDEWVLFSAEDEVEPSTRLNQICLWYVREPLRSYAAGELERIYLKLRFCREDGITYDSQTAVIDRGEPETIPENSTLYACFDSSVRVRGNRPFGYYGRYQITVNAATSPEDIMALLPDTLPVEIQILPPGAELTQYAIGITDCPVTWKKLSLPSLTAGESVTIANAAEEIRVPAGTHIRTPMGTYVLNEPLEVDGDEVRLILNVAPQDGNPTGALRENSSGLEMAFDLKPTGATAITAYTFTEGSADWTKLPGLPLLEAVNARPSAANSGYTVLPDSASQLSAPFLIGLKIEGGVYDGKQLILPWPHTYNPPSDLPVIKGTGGNEGNAGAGNKGDSTEEGQRPNLPGPPDDTQDEEQRPSPTQKPDVAQDEEQRPTPTQKPDVAQDEEQRPTPTQKPDVAQDEEQQSAPTRKPDVAQDEEQRPAPTRKPDVAQDEEQRPAPTGKPGNTQDELRHVLTQKPGETQEQQRPAPTRNPDAAQGEQLSSPTHRPGNTREEQLPDPTLKPDNAENTAEAPRPSPGQEPDDTQYAGAVLPPDTPHKPDNTGKGQGPDSDQKPGDASASSGQKKEPEYDAATGRDRILPFMLAAAGISITGVWRYNVRHKPHRSTLR